MTEGGDNYGNAARERGSDARTTLEKQQEKIQQSRRQRELTDKMMDSQEFDAALIQMIQEKAASEGSTDNGVN